MRRIELKPRAWAYTLEDCPPGFFLFEGQVCFKSEYRTSCSDQLVEAFNSAGEFFWGNAKSSEDRKKIMVLPVVAEWVRC